VLSGDFAKGSLMTGELLLQHSVLFDQYTVLASQNLYLLRQSQTVGDEIAIRDRAPRVFVFLEFGCKKLKLSFDFPDANASPNGSFFFFRHWSKWREKIKKNC